MRGKYKAILTHIRSANLFWSKEDIYPLFKCLFWGIKTEIYQEVCFNYLKRNMNKLVMLLCVIQKNLIIKDKFVLQAVKLRSLSS